MAAEFRMGRATALAEFDVPGVVYGGPRPDSLRRAEERHPTKLMDMLVWLDLDSGRGV